MTSFEINHVTELANLIGKPFNVVCRYEWSRKHQDFRWNYYRNGRLVGNTGVMKSVVGKMEKYIESK